MKVLWFCHFPLSKLNPLPVSSTVNEGEHPAPWVVNLSNAIIKLQLPIELHIASINKFIKKSCSFRRNGITFHLCKPGFDLPFGKQFPPLNWSVKTDFWLFRKMLCGVSHKVQPDIIHAFGTENTYAMAAMDSKIPYLIYIQGILREIDKMFPMDKTRVRRLSLENEVMKDCSYFIAETEFAKQFAKTAASFKRAWLVGNSVSPEYFAAKHCDGIHNRLLFVGSVMPNKGIAELVEVVAGREITLSVVGYCGAYAEKLKVKSKKNKNIQWLGRISTDNIVELMKDQDALVLPSYMDTSPYVIAEAMAAGLPVIASRVGGIPDMVHDGETGILVKPKDKDSLLNGIMRFYSYPSNVKAMRKTARQLAMKRYNPSNNAKIIFESYKYILNDGK